jgi:hypothetical protein
MHLPVLIKRAPVVLSPSHTHTPSLSHTHSLSLSHTHTMSRSHTQPLSLSLSLASQSSSSERQLSFLSQRAPRVSRNSGKGGEGLQSKGGIGKGKQDSGHRRSGKPDVSMVERCLPVLVERAPVVRAQPARAARVTEQRCLERECVCV